MRARGPTVAAILAVWVGACSRPVVPDPRDAAREYAEAAERGDSDALYEMMTSDARRKYGRKGVARAVKNARAELKARGKALASESSEVEATARVAYADGEQATLEITDGEFRVASAGALPAGAQSPEQALDQLRQVLARRSYPGLLRVLSGESRSAMENDLRSLVTGLEHPETLDIEVDGDEAVVRIPGGHVVKLKREAGVWRIDDFD